MKPNCLRILSLLLLASAALTAQVARQETVVPLRNWATPLYWQPNQTERGVAATGAQLTFSSNQVATNALTFIAITPCRLIDTRGVPANFNGIAPFSGPSIPAMTAVTFPVQSSAEATADTTPAPCGTIPSIAQAYSLNLTVVPVGGAVDYISMWPSGYSQPFVATLNDPQGAIVANAAIVPAGTVNGGISVYNQGPANANVIIDMNGFFAAPSDLNGNTAIGSGTLASNTTGNNDTAVGSSALADNTTGVHNTAVGTGALQDNISGGANTAVGNQSLQSNTTGGGNTAVGGLSLTSNTTGNGNTAIGQQSLVSNTAGNNNTASGQFALQNNIGGANTATGQAAMQANTSGCCNTADGQAALNANTTGNSNVAIGGSALQDNTTANNNTAVGQAAMLNNTTGTGNVAVGTGALAANTTSNGNTAIGASALNAAVGTQNTAVGNFALGSNTNPFNSVAIGWQAAASVAGGNNNIHIGNSGTSGDNNVIKIGTAGTQTSAYIAGIWNNTPNVTNLLVCVDANGALGTTGCTSTPSSRRFKEQISDMGESSSRLFQLRPVTFLYKPAYDDGSHGLQYGLIAEEVANVYPDMVGYDKDGQPASVKYQVLAPMLLNEVQKLNAQLQAQNRKLEEKLAELQAQLSSLAATVARPASSQ
jgi:hypothetical protein